MEGFVVARNAIVDRPRVMRHRGNEQVEVSEEFLHGDASRAPHGTRTGKIAYATFPCELFPGYF